MSGLRAPIVAWPVAADLAGSVAPSTDAETLKRDREGPKRMHRNWKGHPPGLLLPP